MKKILLVVIVAAIGIGGFFAYQSHAQSAFKESVVPHLKNASIRVTNSSELDIKPSQATFKEMFDRLDADVAEIDKRLIEVQSISNSKNKELASPAVEYLRSAQEYSRALSMKYRKTLAVSNAVDQFRDAVNDQIASSGYAHEYAKKRADKAQEVADKALVESKDAMKIWRGQRVT